MSGYAPHHVIDFRSNSTKSVSAWDGFRSPRIMCDLTKLRILATRLQVTEPRRADESQAEYSEYISGIIVTKGLSHLNYFMTVAAVDKWLWKHLEQRPGAELIDLDS